MSITIGNYTFNGPFASTNDLQEASGVYAILGRSSPNSKWIVVDIGESEAVKSRVSDHDRAPCWRGQGHGQLAVAALYANETARMRVERELRAAYQPACGER